MAECLTPNIRSGPINCHNAATISAFEARVRSQLAFAARRQAAGGSDNGYDRACKSIRSWLDETDMATAGDDSLSNVVRDSNPSQAKTNIREGPHDEHKRSSVGFFKNMMGKVFNLHRSLQMSLTLVEESQVGRGRGGPPSTEKDPSRLG